MTHVFTIAAIILALAMTLSLYRVLRGPTVFDRLTGLGLIATKTIVLLILMGFMTDRVEIYVDITLSYSLLGFIGSLVLAKYFELKGEERP